MWKRDVAVPMEMADSIIDVDTNHNDPQLCATLACDIYKHLRIAEVIFLSFVTLCVYETKCSFGHMCVICVCMKQSFSYFFAVLHVYSVTSYQ